MLRPLAPEAHAALQGGAPADAAHRGRRSLQVLWPAFVMAGVLEAMLFAVVDPTTLRWFGGEPIAWSVNTIYSVTFFIFWGVIATSAAMTLVLREPEPPG